MCHCTVVCMCIFIFELIKTEDVTEQQAPVPSSISPYTLSSPLQLSTHPYTSLPSTFGVHPSYQLPHVELTNPQAVPAVGVKPNTGDTLPSMSSVPSFSFAVSSSVVGVQPSIAADSKGSNLLLANALRTSVFDSFTLPIVSGSDVRSDVVTSSTPPHPAVSDSSVHSEDVTKGTDLFKSPATPPQTDLAMLTKESGTNQRVILKAKRKTASPRQPQVSAGVEVDKPDGRAGVTSPAAAPLHSEDSQHKNILTTSPGQLQPSAGVEVVKLDGRTGVTTSAAPLHSEDSQRKTTASAAGVGMVKPDGSAEITASEAKKALHCDDFASPEVFSKRKIAHGIRRKGGKTEK